MKLLILIAAAAMTGCAFFHEAFKYNDPKETAAKEAAEAQASRERIAAMMDRIKDVRTGKNDPASTYKEIGSITAYDGEGVGTLGKLGTYENAIIKLKLKAKDMGADYVQIMSIQPPHSETMEFVDTYVISGTAYKSDGK